MERVFGFARYGSMPDFLGIDEPIKETKDVKSPTDIVLEKIFAVDHHGWPNSSIAMYLSPKTSDDIRKFIEQNILVDTSENHAVTDEKVVSEFRKLSSDFIAESSRNRYESIEDYEKRLQGIIQRHDEESIAKRAENLRKKFFEKLKDA